VHTVTVAGASGKTGRHVVEQAAERGWEVRRAGRRDTGGPGRWVPLDWDDPTSWAPAFAGSDAAYVLIPFNHPGAAEATPAVLKAAGAAGVGRIVLLSSWDAAHAADDDPLRVAERALLDQHVHAAVLRPTWFMDNFTHGSFAAMTAEGELRLPCGDGRIPLVDTRDIAAVGVACLAPDGPTGLLPITGPAAVDHHEVAAALAAAAGRAIRYTSVEPEEFIALLEARGFSRAYGQFLADALGEVATGRLVVPVERTVDEVLGRAPHSITEFADHYSALLRS
jgi:uncharacterized protein YbjT (DUF2867 family)